MVSYFHLQLPLTLYLKVIRTINQTLLLLLRWRIKNELTHEIMALIALCKLNLQTRMPSHPMRLHVWFSVRSFVYFYTLYVPTVKALVRLRRCAVKYLHHQNQMKWLKFGETVKNTLLKIKAVVEQCSSPDLCLAIRAWNTGHTDLQVVHQIGFKI